MPPEKKSLGTIMLQHNALKYRGYYYDVNLGLYYLGSRFYDQNICRFVNADTTDVLMANPSSLTDKNLYSYCDNNPVMRADDGGEFWNIAAGAVIGAGISIIGELAGQFVSGQSINTGDVIFAGINGLISGGLAATGVGKMGQTVLYGMVGGAIEFSKQIVRNETINVGKIVKATIIGGASGYLGGDGARVKTSSYGKVTKSMNVLKKYTKNKSYSSGTLAPYKTYLTNVKNFLKPIVTRKTTVGYLKGTGASLLGNYGRRIWKRITGR